MDEMLTPMHDYYYFPSPNRWFTLSYLRASSPRPTLYPHLDLTRQSRVFRARSWHVQGETLAELLGRDNYMLETLDMFPNLADWAIDAFRRVDYVISDHCTSLVAFRVSHWHTIHVRPYAEYFGDTMIYTHHGIRVNDPEFPVTMETLYQRRKEMERLGIRTRIVSETPRQTRIVLD